MAGVFPRSNYVVTARFVIRPDSVNKMRVITHDLTSTSRAENGLHPLPFLRNPRKRKVSSPLS